MFQHLLYLLVLYYFEILVLRFYESLFALFHSLLWRRVWRMDSGDYPTLAQLVIASWQQRSASRQAAGLQALPKPQLMHSNIDSIEDIRQVRGC